MVLQFHSWRGVVLKEVIKIITVAFILPFDQKWLMFLTEKVYMDGNESMLNRFSTTCSGLNPPRHGS